SARPSWAGSATWGPNASARPRSARRCSRHSPCSGSPPSCSGGPAARSRATSPRRTMGGRAARAGRSPLDSGRASCGNARMTKQTAGARARARLAHPVVDADGHSQEYIPAIDAYLRKQGVDVGVHALITGLLGPDAHRWAELSPAERARVRALRPPWWAMPTKNTLDFATATVPRLLESRLEELGIDFGIVYPTLALGFPSIQNDELRLAACRAINAYHAELYAEHRRRLTPVALIPMHTPQEAIAALDHAVVELGLRAVMIASYVSRPIAHVAERAPELAPYAQ